jgi:hypothetical protein
VDGLLSFWVLSTIFAIIGTAIKGLIRPISWATLALATLFIAPSKVSEAVNAIRAGEVQISMPSLPPPPEVISANSPAASPASPGPVALRPGESPATEPVGNDSILSSSPTRRATDRIAIQGWPRANDTALAALPADTNVATDPTGTSSTGTRPSGSSAASGTSSGTGSTSSTTNPPANTPPVQALW